jgi:hypothetical protein
MNEWERCIDEWAERLRNANKEIDHLRTDLAQARALLAEAHEIIDEHLPGFNVWLGQAQHALAQPGEEGV